ncbi:MAG: hypothetical protein K2J71_01485, partial [Oscillospiraceae bacterium]|nr:hypothetical protein [Oscillospiraceae bacterium]
MLFYQGMRYQKLIGIAGIVLLVSVMILTICINLTSHPASERNPESDLESESELNPIASDFPETLENLQSLESEKIPEITENPEIPKFPQIMVEIPEIHQQESLMIVEAELANYSDSLSVQSER